MDPDARNAMRSAGRVSAVGIEIAASVIVSLLIGNWADSKLGTSPWLTLAGIIVGALAGFKVLYRTVQTIQKQAEEDEKASRPKRNEGEP